MPQFRRSYIASAGRRDLLRGWAPRGRWNWGCNDVRNSDGWSFAARRRIGLSDKAALLCGALACAFGAAAWINESFSSRRPSLLRCAGAFLFRGAVCPSGDAESPARPPLQPLDRPALAALESKVQDAKGCLRRSCSSANGALPCSMRRRSRARPTCRNRRARPMCRCRDRVPPLPMLPSLRRSMTTPRPDASGQD